VKTPSVGVQFALLAWMALAVFIYALVTLPADSSVSTYLPLAVLEIRSVVREFFFDYSIL